MEKPNLATTHMDIIAAFARGVANACPYVGGLIAEAINITIPNQKMDRVVAWVQLVDSELAVAQAQLDRVTERLQTSEGLDLLEDGITQSARALSEERRQHLAHLVSHSLSQDELKYAESKKFLNLLRELTDPEVITLIFYSKPMRMRSEWHTQLMQRHPEVLGPVSATRGHSQEELDRAALQTSYKNTLLRLGLLQERDQHFDLTGLGRLFLRYIVPSSSTSTTQ